MNLITLLFIFLCMKFPLVLSEQGNVFAWDSNGYIMYCPCMGRFGNQAEQFLGALRFAKELNRTMIVPPWISYDPVASTSFTPYDTWFDIIELRKFHRVLLMRDFMEFLAPDHWPDDEKSRKIYCPTVAAKRSPDAKSCPAKIGNPFGPFWDNFDIDFTGGSELYSHGALSGFTANAWNSAYPVAQNPVIAFMGAPGSFPILEKNRFLQKYVKWSEKIASIANSFINIKIERPFIGIHLRNGQDWVRACEHLKESSGHFMGSAQCVGYDRNSPYKLTREMCLPSKEEIIKRVTEVARIHKAKQIFIATDNDAMIEEFANTPFKVTRYDEDHPIVDLAVLTAADAFIGNCVSTFTSFVVRHREIEQKPNYFFAFDHPHSKIIIHEDL